jgi:cytochrome o ubiquinol oxidase operon protein cyoD
MNEGTYKSYIIGFLSSIALTLAAYSAVTKQLLSDTGLLSIILALAVVQLIVQLFFFLHLGARGEKRSQLGIFISTIGLVLIIVVGSIWIMNHLNYSMTPMQINQYIQNQAGGF